jgi:hypothetical protein
MDLKQPLDKASNAIELAEDATDNSSRVGYLKLAGECLAEADIEEWMFRKRPTVILALE